MKKINCLILLVLVPELALAMSGTSIDSNTSDDQIQQVIDACVKTSDMNGLLGLHEQATKLFSQTDPSRFAHISNLICNALATHDFHNDGQYSLSSDIALTTLETAKSKCTMLDRLTLASRLRPKDVSGSEDKSSLLRSRQLLQWVAALDQIDIEAKKALNPNDQASPNAPVPGFENAVIAGGSSTVITDPEKRKEYEAAVQARNRREEQYRLTSIARQRKTFYFRCMEDYLRVAFSKLGPNSMASELSASMTKLGLTPDRQAELTAEIISSK